MIALAQFAPTPRHEALHEANGFADAKPGARIESSRPIEAVLKWGEAAASPIVAMADDCGLDGRLFVWPHPKKGSAFGSANPFVQIARIIGRAKFAQIERHHSGCVRAIDECVHAQSGEFANNAL